MVMVVAEAVDEIVTVIVVAVQPYALYLDLDNYSRRQSDEIHLWALHLASQCMSVFDLDLAASGQTMVYH